MTTILQKERDEEGSRWGKRKDYDEKEQARERQRDRQRYDERRRDDDRKYDSNRRDDEKRSRKSLRRSASPRRGHSSSGSRSRSRSPVDRSKPNLGPSGLLAAETNTVKAIDGRSTVLKYNEPPEARKPLVGWRLYVFKGEEQVEMLHIQRQSCYLVGRDRLVADIAVDHPSCSKQHAVIQYRQVHEKDEYGNSKAAIKPFIIDLESTNGTTVNDEQIPVSRYYELKPRDVIKFGQSTREYVLLHDEVS
ncbi:SMAD/FHA domain-containing protein [Fistulina hepatica ATCC 64428]|uniref:SMAD/FHA domain-containing protein n=1 Tax=Fistulina hepatica ATCC 64428 TaxID=1128425 RepID=A0A0D7A2C0_9AGAR|nr:SMAD/FHA domain-containing protein [Fistulina hepatica ATCC 64428]